MIERIRARQSGALAYGITPPKLGLGEARIRDVAERQSERVAALPVDALVVYDIQDESLRTDTTRPFPYAPCVPSVDYALSSLANLHIPKVVYQCVGAVGEEQLSRNLQRLSSESDMTVFVGAASKEQVPTLSLRDGYALKSRVAPRVPLGGLVDGRAARLLELPAPLFSGQAPLFRAASWFGFATYARSVADCL